MMSNSSDAASSKAQKGIECSLRVVDGDVPGLTRKWSHGVAKVFPGRIEFVGMIGGIRLLKRRTPIEIPVDRVISDRPGEPEAREAISINLKARTIRLVTSSATVEWALLPEQIPVALDRLKTSS
jgi:hypothetical protein